MANCPVCLQPPCFSTAPGLGETASGMNPEPSEVRPHGGGGKGKMEGRVRSATCGHLVSGKPGRFPLIGRAICSSWDGLKGRIPLVKNQCGAGILRSEHRGIVSGAAEESRQVAPSVRECV